MAKIIDQTGSLWPTTKVPALATTVFTYTATPAPFVTPANSGTCWHIPSNDLHKDALAVGCTGYLINDGVNETKILPQGTGSGTNNPMASKTHSITRWFFRLRPNGDDFASTPAGFYIARVNNVSIGFQLGLAAANGIKGCAVSMVTSGIGSPVAVPMALNSGNQYDPVVPFDEWVEAELHIFSDATTGYIRLYINGDLVGLSTAANTANLTWSSAQVCIMLPVVTGLQVQVSAPIQVWDADDSAYIRPRHDLVDSEYAQKAIKWYGFNHNGGFQHVSGTGAAVSLETPNGISTGRYICRVPGGGSAQVIQSYDDLGVIKFNPFGWACLATPVISQPTDGVLKVQVLKRYGSKPEFELIFGSDQTIKLRDTGGTLRTLASSVPFSTTATDGVKFQVLFMFSEWGELRVLILDGTHHPQTQAGSVVGPYKSMGLGYTFGWSGTGELGKLQFSVTPGATIETRIANWYLAPWMGVIIGDSMSSNVTVNANYNSNETLQLENNNLTFLYFNSGADRHNIANALWPYRDTGMSYRFHPIVFGAGGNKRSNYYTNFKTTFQDCQALFLHFYDGFGVNDFAADDYQTVLTAVLDDLNKISTSTNNPITNNLRYFVTTMALRPKTGKTNSLDADSQAMISAYNAWLRAHVPQAQVRGLIEFADWEAAVADHSTLYAETASAADDAIHPSSASPAFAYTSCGLKTMSDAIAANRSLCRQFSPRQSHSGSMTPAVATYIETIRMTIRNNWVPVSSLIDLWCRRRGIDPHADCVINQIDVISSDDGLQYRASNSNDSLTLAVNTAKTFTGLDIDQQLMIRSNNPYRSIVVQIVAYFAKAVGN